MQKNKSKILAEVSFKMRTICENGQQWKMNKVKRQIQNDKGKILVKVSIKKREQRDKDGQKSRVE